MFLDMAQYILMCHKEDVTYILYVIFTLFEGGWTQSVLQLVTEGGDYKGMWSNEWEGPTKGRIVGMVFEVKMWKKLPKCIKYCKQKQNMSNRNKNN